MKKAVFIGILAVLFCVFCACQKENDTPPPSSDALTSAQEEPTRTRVPVVTSTLPPLPEVTEAPEVTPEIDTSLFRPETFPDREDGTLELVPDEPGYGEIGQPSHP